MAIICKSSESDSACLETSGLPPVESLWSTNTCNWSPNVKINQCNQWPTNNLSQSKAPCYSFSWPLHQLHSAVVCTFTQQAIDPKFENRRKQIPKKVVSGRACVVWSHVKNVAPSAVRKVRCLGKTKQKLWLSHQQPSTLHSWCQGCRDLWNSCDSYCCPQRLQNI